MQPCALSFVMWIIQKASLQKPRDIVLTLAGHIVSFLAYLAVRAIAIRTQWTWLDNALESYRRMQSRRI
ncbi:hypothetical protein WT54_28295 [Burkholderia territorii]|nr:hypothetical protein WT54_28295 [Burkholderia territorii]